MTKPKEIVDKIIKLTFLSFLFTASNRGAFRGLKLNQEEIFCGAAWWAIPKDRLNEIFALYNSFNNKYYKHISTPKEHFFQTYLMKTSFTKWVAFGKQYEKTKAQLLVSFLVQPGEEAKMFVHFNLTGMISSFSLNPMTSMIMIIFLQGRLICHLIGI